MAPRRLLCGILGAFALLAAGCTPYYTPSPSAGHPCNIYGVSASGTGNTYCDTTGNSWTMRVHPDNPGDCVSYCGINYTYRWPDLSHKPWASGGQLVFQFDYSVLRSVVPGDWHGFFCVQLTDTVSRQSLLYCLEPWRPFGYGYAPEQVTWDPTEHSPWGPWGGYNVQTHFGGGATLATALSGSALSKTPPVDGTYKGIITSTQVLSVLQDANAGVARHEPTNQYIGPYSLDPANYAVESFQCGGEGYGGPTTDVVETCGNVSIGTTATQPAG